MKKIIAKPVEMFELFYDLIFVYAISRITAMIHHPVNGNLNIVAFWEFLLVVAVVMQIWLYQTVYVNRYSKNSIFDIVCFFINMFAVVYLANNINTEWRVTFQYFNISMAIILLDLIVQYLVNGVKNNKRDAISFVFVLSIEIIIILIGLIISYPIGVYFSIVGSILGYGLAIIFYSRFDPREVNFPHLVERVSLIVIIAFGEAIVNMTAYFNEKTPLIYPILLFLSLLFMFTSYQQFSDKLINHHQISRGFVLMYSHIGMVLSVLLFTVAMIYLKISNINVNTVAGLFIGAVAIYFGSLYSNATYLKKTKKFTLKDAALICIILVIGILLVWFSKESRILMLLSLLIWNLLNFGFVEFKIRK